MVSSEPTSLLQDCTEPAIVSLKPRYGSSDLNALADLEHAVRSEMDGSDRRLIIDMQQTAYIGCEFLNVLTRCHRRAQHPSQKISLCNLGEFSDRVLKAAKLDTVFEIYHTRDDAIAGRHANRMDELSYPEWNRDPAEHSRGLRG